MGGEGEGRRGESVCRGPQGGSERAREMEGGGEGCCSTALCSRQALSGHTITQVGRTSNNKNNTKKRGRGGWRSSLLDPVEHEHVECFQTPKIMISKVAM